ncbi:MAG: hypothetical protein CMH52_07520 [Myxococcales bacterium]|nr:hypothetical protein [Myxococcales bacterium]
MDRPANLDLELVAHVVEHGIAQADAPSQWLKGLCDDLVEWDLPLAKVHVTFVPRHPQLRVGVLKWLPHQPMSWGHISWPEGNVRSPVFRRNPIYLLRERRVKEVRTRLTDESRSRRYRLTEELAKEGMSDYLAIAVDSGMNCPNTISFVTDQKGGFTEHQLDRLRSVAWATQLVMQRDTWRALSETICQTYIGLRAGQKVLDGDMKRGQYTRMSAVVWFCDMRSFSALLERRDDIYVFDTLNVFFDAVGTAIQSRGGEILKFIGDSVLGIFPYTADEDATHACQSAYEAATTCLSSLDEINRDRLARGLENLRCGVALNRGEVLYGNIGTQTRLDFTVMGQTVNIASRLEALCGDLGEHLLMTDSVADLLDEELMSLGSHELKGVQSPQKVFGLPAERVYESSQAPQVIPYPDQT